MDELEMLREEKKKELLDRQQKPPAPNTPITLTDADFDDAVTNHSLLVVDFWAPWCGPCRAVGPIVDKLATELSGSVVFGKVNVDENPGVSARFQIASIPTLLVLRDGRVVDQILGAVPEKNLRQQLQRHLT